jgi:hypothetical protein
MNEPDIFGTFDHFKQHLPIGGDFTMMILKGHLLIEEQMNLLLEARIPKVSALKNANFTTHQKILLSEAVIEETYSDGQDAWLWPAILKLNTLRNDIAHNLSKPGILDRIKDFVERVPTKLESTNLCHNFEIALWTTCSEVHLRVKAPDPSDYKSVP